MSNLLIHHAGIRTRSGETYGVVFTDEHAFDAMRQLRDWALNPKLSLTHDQADAVIEIILTRDTSNAET